jgi:biotin carboxyl carrier protein
MVNKETSLKSIENESGEAHAYTPGLKVKRSMTVAKLRRLPLLGEVFVKKGDIVSYNEIVARTKISGDPQIVKVAMHLGLEPEDLSKYMNVKLGDTIEEGQQLASYNALFGLIKRQVEAPVSGTIESISEITGQVILRGSPIPVEIDAYIPGTVAEVIPREGAVIETNAAFVQGIFGIGPETHGDIKVLVEKNRDIINVDLITENDKDKVLIGGSMITLEALQKAVDVGVSAIVSGGIRHQDLTKFTGEEIGVAITGQEEVGLTVIITEGFGKMTMSQRTFDLLKSFENFRASVNGTTQIRAGVLRPEIIIPHEDREDEKSEALSQGMMPGTPIRIIRQPYFGAIGKVYSLPVELQSLESESKVRVLNVELDNGDVVTVPRANVEIIEE